LLGFQQLQFPPFPTSEEEIEQWGRDFEDLNVDWILQLNKARNQLVDFFVVARRMLAPDRDIDAFLTHLHTTRLKFATNRLCSLGLMPIAEQVAEEVINRPWLTKPHWICRGLSNCGYYELLLKIGKEGESAFIRAQALRSLGQHTNVDGVREELWSVLLDKKATVCEKLKASEGLLDGDNWENAEFDVCTSLIEREEDHYLRKNYVLILGQAFKETSRPYLVELQMRDPPPIVTDAIQYLLSSGFTPLLSNSEPDALSKYYDRYYPDDESDDKSDESDPSWIPF
jgi:hypothetical protein